ncbi:MAG: tripartite tricarboxylate transporter substrate binding protein [Betaproteobacteria bacterium]|nr:tripartite tricarboxylate transporter substrate binding protein [Betaproteobacteria bacterium]PWB59592.1 MAG: ABC transporter substrate-binding protein [Betaproteobacteria bacterium]
MKTFRFIAAAVLVAVAPLALHAAEPFPGKQIRFVVPYPPGGPLDTVARLLGQKVSASVKHPVVIDNVPGAGGNIGAGMVARAAPDGYTILMGAVATHAINPTLYPTIPYNAEKDFVAVTQVASTPNVLVVNPALEAATVAEFIKLGKSKPGKLNFGSGSTGSAGHLAGELFKSMAGVDMAHIPYKGAAAAMQDLIGGRVDLMFDNFASSAAQVKAGRVRALAVTTARRSALAPELPTIAESGLPGFDISTWFGIFVPAGTPRPVVERLHDEFVKALAAPDVREKMLNLGAEPVGNTPEEFAAYVRSEAAKYAKLVKTSGAKVD